MELPQSSFSLCTAQPLGWVPPSRPCSLCLSQELPHGSKIQPRSLFLQESPHHEIFLKNCTQRMPTSSSGGLRIPCFPRNCGFPPKGVRISPALDAGWKCPGLWHVEFLPCSSNSHGNFLGIRWAGNHLHPNLENVFQVQLDV